MNEDTKNKIADPELLKALTESNHFRGAAELTQRVMNRASAVASNATTSSTESNGTTTSGNNTTNQSGS